MNVTANLSPRVVDYETVIGLLYTGFIKHDNLFSNSIKKIITRSLETFVRESYHTQRCTAKYLIDTLHDSEKKYSMYTFYSIPLYHSEPIYHTDNHIQHDNINNTDKDHKSDNLIKKYIIKNCIINTIHTILIKRNITILGLNNPVSNGTLSKIPDPPFCIITEGSHTKLLAYYGERLDIDYTTIKEYFFENLL